MLQVDVQVIPVLQVDVQVIPVLQVDVQVIVHQIKIFGPHIEFLMVSLKITEIKMCVYSQGSKVVRQRPIN